MDNLAGLTREVASSQGSRSVDSQRFIKATAVGVTNADTPTNRGKAAKRRREQGSTEGEQSSAAGTSNALPVRKVASRLKVANIAMARHLKAARALRRRLQAHESDAYVMHSRRRLGPRKVTPEWITEWIAARKVVRRDLSPYKPGHTRRAGTSPSRRRRWHQSSSCCTRASRWRTRSCRRAAPHRCSAKPSVSARSCCRRPTTARRCRS